MWRSFGPEDAVGTSLSERSLRRFDSGLRLLNGRRTSTTRREICQREARSLSGRQTRTPVPLWTARSIAHSIRGTRPALCQARTLLRMVRETGQASVFCARRVHSVCPEWRLPFHRVTGIPISPRPVPSGVPIRLDSIFPSRGKTVPHPELPPGLCEQTSRKVRCGTFFLSNSGGRGK